MEQRKYFRAKLNNAEVNISDRAGFCTATLKDCSRFGVCITDIPRKIHTKDGFFLAVISNGSIHFKLKIKECWQTKDGLATKVGGAIENAQWEWTEMVMAREPKSNDVWGSY